MKGRRTVAGLCVLLAHVLVVYALLAIKPSVERAPDIAALETAPITLFLEPLTDLSPDTPGDIESPDTPADVALPEPARESAPPANLPTESSAISMAPDGVAGRGRVDWPLEAKKSAARVLAAEAEAQRMAKMFAGPGGTWASLTRRQRSEISKFRWRRGVEGLKYDEKGNAIYELPNGCTVVNFIAFGCPIGFKAKVHGNMFEDMRLYFDEQRLPQTDAGNGTEPEALRPAN